MNKSFGISFLQHQFVFPVFMVTVSFERPIDKNLRSVRRFYNLVGLI